MLKDSYLHLSTLKKLKRYTWQSVRKQLAESLIFSRLDYCNKLFIDLPQYQVRRMIKLQKSCASFVKGKYCSIEDAVSLKWLLVPERTDFTVLKGLLNERMPSNFQVSIKEKKRELRTVTETTKLTLTSDPNYESHFIKYATTLYNEFQNQYKKLKNIVLLFLSSKGICFTFTIKFKKRWPWVWCVERKTYSYSHVQPCFWLYQLRLLSGTITRGRTFFSYVSDVMWYYVFSIFKVPNIEFRFYLHTNQYSVNFYHYLICLKPL